ncbi:MAG: chorismate mutase [Acidimicrobiales bacterium]
MSDAPQVRALRGATTVDADTVEEVGQRVHELLGALLEHNGLVEDDIISIIFTATADVVSTFPATAARNFGFGAVPLLCASEIPVPGAMPRCIRALMHISTTLGRDELRHVYLHGAQSLRDDLPG